MPLSKLIIAIAMNLFLVPGSGQAFLKHKKRGMLITAATVLLMLVFSFHLSVMLSELMSQIKFSTDLFALSQNLTQDLMQKKGAVLKIYMFLIGVVYIATVVDVILIYMNAKAQSVHSGVVAGDASKLSSEASEKGKVNNSPYSLSTKPSAVKTNP